MRARLELAPDTAAVYRRALRSLTDAHVPFLLGGAWAMARLAGVRRRTKDIDLFVRPSDVDRTLATLAASEFRTELLSPVWLGKAWSDELFVDIIFSSGNGIATVDDVWFEHSIADEALGVPILYCPAEETLWSKAWIMERERFDGADVAHLLRARGPVLDWTRLLRRFGAHWRVLLGHLVLFGYIYPNERDRVPGWVMRELSSRLLQELTALPPAGRVCQGPLLSVNQYRADLERWGYSPPDLAPPPVQLAEGAEDGEPAYADPPRGRG
jgi:hypothetical protein